MTPNLGLSFRHFSAPACLNLNQVRQFTCDLPCWSPWGFDLYLKVHWHFKVQCFDKIVYVIKWNVVHTAMLNGTWGNVERKIFKIYALCGQLNIIVILFFLFYLFILFYFFGCIAALHNLLRRDLFAPKHWYVGPVHLLTLIMMQIFWVTLEYTTWYLRHSVKVWHFWNLSQPSQDVPGLIPLTVVCWTFFIIPQKKKLLKPIVITFRIPRKTRIRQKLNFFKHYIGLSICSVKYLLFMIMYLCRIKCLDKWTTKITLQNAQIRWEELTNDPNFRRPRPNLAIMWDKAWCWSI